MVKILTRIYTIKSWRNNYGWRNLRENGLQPDLGNQLFMFQRTSKNRSCCSLPRNVWFGKQSVHAESGVHLSWPEMNRRICKSVSKSDCSSSKVSQLFYDRICLHAITQRTRWSGIRANNVHFKPNDSYPPSIHRRCVQSRNTGYYEAEWFIFHYVYLRGTLAITECF